jgi:SAM-dependent methyltransferase
MPDSVAWNNHYVAGRTPWDLGRPHPELQRRLDRDSGLGTGVVGRVVVPGAGNGHDAVALAHAGWSVTAVDVADAVEGRLTSVLEPHDGRVIIADALDVDDREPFDLVFDHTFFCAIDPDRRPDFGSLCRRVLAPGGSVVSIVFPIGRPASVGGPPWAIEPDTVALALGSRFRLADLSEANTVAGRRWHHRWARWVFDG